MIRESDVSDVHIAPHTLRVAAMFSILTRLKDPKKGRYRSCERKCACMMGKMSKDIILLIFDELKKEYQDEGMSGIDPRYVINRISSTIIRKENPSINALDVLMSLKEGLDQHPSITNELRERYLNFISLARKEYDEIAKNEVQKAFVYSYEESAKILMDNYLDNVEAYCNKSRLRDPLTGEEINPDEKIDAFD